MNIVINITPLKNIITGIGRTIISLSHGLINSNIDVNFFDGKCIEKKLKTQLVNKNKWEKMVAIAWKLPPIIIVLLRRYIYKKQEAKFNTLAKDYSIYHEMGFLPYKLNQKNVKTVLTINDMSLLEHPEWHPKERVMYFNKYWKESFKYADFFVTPSEFTKESLIKYFPQAKNKIKVIHWAYDENIFYHRDKSEILKVLEKYNITGNYFICVGTNDPRKNFNSIVNAFENLKNSYDVKLVIVGWSGWANNNLSTNEKIITTGHVEDNELACLYSGALGLIYVSFYEGFGLPILEAFACGIPVITSNTTSMPEVAGDGAILINPHSIQELTKAMENLLCNPKEREKLIENGYNQVKKFSWEKCATEYISVYKNVISL